MLASPAQSHPVPPSLSSPPSSSSSSSPRLPPELLLQILLSPELSPTLHPTPQVFTTLKHLLYTSRLCNACAREQIYKVLILPRRVRDFRRYYDKEREKGWPGIGVTRGLFIALDDVSRLTHTSAGWESAFLRMLHILGPSITHVSLWHSESRTLLRDAGQRRGAKGGPAWSWSGSEDDGESSSSRNSSSSDEDDGNGNDAAPRPLPSEAAAIRERARQKMPMWLQREIANSASPSEVAQRHRAHLLPFTDPDNPAANDALQRHLSSQHPTTRKDKRRLKGCRPTSLSIVLSLPLFENQEAQLFASMIIFSKVRELDVFIPVPAHAPKLLHLLSHLRRSPLVRLKVSTTHFTLCMGLPPFNPAQEVEMQRQQRRRKQQQANGDDADTDMSSPSLNLADTLSAFLHTSSTLRDTIFAEFSGRHVDAQGVSHLERLLVDTAIQHGQRQSRGAKVNGPLSDLSLHSKISTASSGIGIHRNRNSFLRGVGGGRGGDGSGDVHDDDDASRRGGLASTLYDPLLIPHRDDTAPPIRIRVFQRNQAHWGKLKDRRDDFVKRVMPGCGMGVWAQCGVWDEDEG